MIQPGLETAAFPSKKTTVFDFFDGRFFIRTRSLSKSHFFSPEKSPEKSFVVILTTYHLIGWSLILPKKRVPQKVTFFLQM